MKRFYLVRFPLGVVGAFDLGYSEVALNERPGDTPQTVAVRAAQEYVATDAHDGYDGWIERAQVFGPFDLDPAAPMVALIQTGDDDTGYDFAAGAVSSPIFYVIENTGEPQAGDWLGELPDHRLKRYASAEAAQARNAELGNRWWVYRACEEAVMGKPGLRLLDSL